MWYYTYEGHHLGPVDLKGLRNLMRTGGVTAASLIKEENWDEWKRLNETDLIWLYEEIVQNKKVPAEREIPGNDDEEEDEVDADENIDEDEKIWYYQMNGMHFGPVGVNAIEDMLRRGDLNEVDWVRREGEQNWRHLDETDLVWTLQNLQDERENDDSEEVYEDDDEESGPETLLNGDISTEEVLWYYLLDDKLYGPVTTAEIVIMRAQGEVYGQTPVSHEQNGPWQMLDETELANLRAEDFKIDNQDDEEE